MKIHFPAFQQSWEAVGNNRITTLESVLLKWLFVKPVTYFGFFIPTSPFRVSALCLTSWLLSGAARCPTAVENEDNELHLSAQVETAVADSDGEFGSCRAEWINRISLRSERTVAHYRCKEKNTTRSNGVCQSALLHKIRILFLILQQTHSWFYLYKGGPFEPSGHGGLENWFSIKPVPDFPELCSFLKKNKSAHILHFSSS